MKTCRKCNFRDALYDSQKCEICTLKAISCDHFKTIAYWKDLAEILISQRHKCPYSGATLYLGKNASLDHIIAKGNGGSNTIDNVQWVHKLVNFMKGCLDENNFVEEFKLFIIESSDYLLSE